MKTLVILCAMIVGISAPILAQNAPICITAVFFDDTIVYTGPDDLILVARRPVDIDKFTIDRFRPILVIQIITGPSTNRGKLVFSGHEELALAYVDDTTADVYFAQFDTEQGQDISQARIVREDGSFSPRIIPTSKHARSVMTGTQVTFLSLDFRDPDYDVSQADAVALPLVDLDICSP